MQDNTKEIHTYYNDIKFNQLDTIDKRYNNIKRRLISKIYN